MKNSVKVTIKFSYKGQNYQPSSMIDLDALMESNQPIPTFIHLVAKQNNIDPYSYEYEVMEMGTYEFSDASGLAVEYCTPGVFDVDGFFEAWKKNYVELKLSEIASQCLAVDNLKQHEDLYEALMKAYLLGLKRR